MPAPSTLGLDQARAKADAGTGRAVSTPRTWVGLPHGASVVVDAAPLICLLEGHPAFRPCFIGLCEAEAAGHRRRAIIHPEPAAA